jgi:hypothetical protein
VGANVVRGVATGVEEGAGVEGKGVLTGVGVGVGIGVLDGVGIKVGANEGVKEGVRVADGISEILVTGERFTILLEAAETDGLTDSEMFFTI